MLTNRYKENKVRYVRKERCTLLIVKYQEDIVSEKKDLQRVLLRIEGLTKSILQKMENEKAIYDVKQEEALKVLVENHQEVAVNLFENHDVLPKTMYFQGVNAGEFLTVETNKKNFDKSLERDVSRLCFLKKEAFCRHCIDGGASFKVYEVPYGYTTKNSDVIKGLPLYRSLCSCGRWSGPVILERVIKDRDV